MMKDDEQNWFTCPTTCINTTRARACISVGMSFIARLTKPGNTILSAQPPVTLTQSPDAASH